MTKVLAFDYGASSGRAVIGHFDGSKLMLEEIHRFSNDPVMMLGRYHWDTPRLLHELKQGILKFVQSGKGDAAGIGIDTWGVDFGLLDKNGALLGLPYHYRDTRTMGMDDHAATLMARRDIYEITGIQFVPLNSLFQLLAQKRENPEVLKLAETLLFMPDLLNYFLTGRKVTEYTIASTSQLLDARTGNWSDRLTDAMGLPRNIFTEIVQPGTVIGNLTEEIQSELGVKSTPVIAVAGHDTASAVVSVPAPKGEYAYLSSGTWSLLGVEAKQPVITDKTYELNYTNEGGFDHTIRLLKNIMGLWIHQECKRAWEKEGIAKSFDELEQEAAEAKPFSAFIDVDDNSFYTPGHMPDKITQYCKTTGQAVPQTQGAITRCIMESLALRYRSAVEGLEVIAGHRIPQLNIVGGGTKNVMLNQFAANALNRTVVTGPIEATAIGNVISQLVALGEVKDLEEGRQVVRNSFPVSNYEPKQAEAWDAAYEKYLKAIKR